MVSSKKAQFSQNCFTFRKTEFLSAKQNFFPQNRISFRKKGQVFAQPLIPLQKSGFNDTHRKSCCRDERKAECVYCCFRMADIHDLMTRSYNIGEIFIKPLIIMINKN